MRALALTLCLTLAPLTAWAQQPSDLEALSAAEAEARQTEARLREQRASVVREIDQLKARLNGETAQIRAFEVEDERLETRVENLTQQIAILQSDLARNRDDTQQLLAALQRVQLAPSIASYADPDDAVRTAQAATTINLLSQRLQTRARETIALAQSLEDARAMEAERLNELARNREQLNRRRAETSRLVAEKERLQASLLTDEDQARLEANRLAAEAATLRELLERVRAAAQDVTPRLKPGQAPSSGPVELPPGTVRFAEAQGALIKPVSGRMTRGYGRGERGQTYSAPTGGQVIAPYAGRVEFSGPFRNYGQVVILNMDDGYFLLLTGLDETFVSAGETVTRGEPVGQMPDTGSRAPLYLELRRNGRTIDPSPWIG